MNIEQNLTKENFLDRMMQLYPNTTTRFCKWVDEYKEAVGWNKLFNDGIERYVPGSAFTATVYAPKFHDLPYAIQMGIWILYVQDMEDMTPWMQGWDFSDYNLSEDIEEIFRLSEIGDI